MRLSGHENLSASELADLLGGDEIPEGDVCGMHSALLILCRRVSELEAQVESAKRSSAAAMNTASCLAYRIGPP